MTKSVTVQPLDARSAARVFAALSDVGRLRILEVLGDLECLGNDGPEASCGEIAEAVGMSYSLVSHHLAVLRDAGLIESRKDGLYVFNSLNHHEIEQVFETVRGFSHMLRPRTFYSFLENR